MFPRQRAHLQVERLEDRCVPATFTVKNLDDAGAGSLRGVIADANLTTAADAIVFKKGLEGTILLTSGEIAISNNLTVSGPSASKIAVSGNFASRIFNVDNGGGGADLTVKLSGLELRHSRAAGHGGAVVSQENVTLTKMVFTLNQAAGFGGAISCTGSLTVTKSTISGNTASSGNGGGIYANTATITGSTIAGNTASLFGGGISCSTATITGSTITGNTASGAGDGGGISCSTATITSSAITGNTASSGGGISCDTATVTGSTISGNSAGTTGGGVYCDTATITGSTIAGNSAGTYGGGILCGSTTITGSTLAGNSAGDSGGGIVIALGASPSEIRNSTISGNRATDNGGGIYGFFASLQVRNCTIAFNQAGAAGGGMAIASSSALLESCLVADNTAGTGGKNLASLNVADTFNLDHCLISVFVGGDATINDIAANQFNVDARLAPLAFNGGKTQTHALKKGSLAIDAGLVTSGLTTDQRGGLFKRKVGGGVDIGAFERQ